MPTFGFSAFVKLLSLNDRPQKTELRNRLRPSDGGYDFHRSLKLRAQRFMLQGENFDEILASCSEIPKAPERESASAGLRNLRDWRALNPGETTVFNSKLFDSPGGQFKVHFTPDFGLRIGGLATATHIYNTHAPLIQRMAHAALTLFPDLYGSGQGTPEDLAVLSLRDLRLHRLCEASDAVLLGSRVVRALDELILDIRDELGLPPALPSGPRPTSP